MPARLDGLRRACSVKAMCAGAGAASRTTCMRSRLLRVPWVAGSCRGGFHHRRTAGLTRRRKRRSCTKPKGARSRDQSVMRRRVDASIRGHCCRSMQRATLGLSTLCIFVPSVFLSNGSEGMGPRPSLPGPRRPSGGPGRPGPRPDKPCVTRQDYACIGPSPDLAAKRSRQH